MNEARYFRVGLFVLGGIALAVAVIVIVGGGRLFARPIGMETVFEESVQGLDVGAPVKLRGVKLGSVSWIGFVGDEYPEADARDANLVLVRMELHRDEALLEEQRARELQAMIDRGLRLRLTPLGITGVSFLEADFVDPGRFPARAISWTPAALYVPSAPSTITQITSAAERLMTRIDRLDVEGLLTNLDTLLVNVNRAVETTDVGAVQRSVSELLEELDGTVEGLRQAIRETRLPAVGERARATLGEASATLVRLQLLLASGGEDLTATLENLRVATQNLRDLSETARSYPSFLLFGQPPPSTLPAGEEER
ncbi:MAG: MlaD family protein [Deltaproteobacteria bacterium]|nr:MlaD family protein [Deltaproteobacteria bacterium]